MAKLDGKTLVLGVPAEALGGFVLSETRFWPMSSPPPALLGRAELRPRTDKLERDESFLQFAAYSALCRSGTCFGYVRASGGDGRLARKASLGVGGHVESTDVPPCAAITSGHAWSAVFKAARRELAEEVGYSAAPPEFRGLIVDRSDPVGRVHLGFAFSAECPQGWGPTLESGLDSMGWMDARTIGEELSFDPFENWSRMIAPHVPGWSPPSGKGGGS